MLYNTKQGLPDNWGLVVHSMEDCALVKQIMSNLSISNSYDWSFNATGTSVYIFSKGSPNGCRDMQNFKPPYGFLFFTVQEFLNKSSKNIEIY